MTKQVNYQYNAMPFELKNDGMMCQRIMDKIFQEEVGETLEVYMDDIKFSQEELHA